MSYDSVLIIDDNEADRFLLSRLIKKAQISECIIEKCDGLEAMKFLVDDYENNLHSFTDKFPPCLIFLDINMPKMDGFEFLACFSAARAKNPDAYDSVVFMMFTSSANQKEMDEALSYDFVKGFITKMPDTQDELLQAIAGAR